MRRLILFSVYLFVLLEGFARFYLCIAYNAPFLKPAELVFQFYPQLQPVAEQNITKDDDNIDILLIGASVLHPDWGFVQQALQQELTAAEPKQAFRIHNVASKAHTTMDSRYKYQHLADKQFDAVVIYHGINELRMNNCPPEVFREDYSHYSWYDFVNAYERHKGSLAFTAMPLAADLIWKTIAVALGKHTYVHTGTSISESREYGGKLKSLPVFQNNIRAIVALATKKGEPVIIPTFAFHIPADYSLDRFQAHTLPSGLETLAIESWSSPENVRKGITASNNFIRALAAKDSNVQTVDLAKAHLTNDEYFVDVCHLNQSGSSVFARAVAPLLSSPEERN